MYVGIPPCRKVFRGYVSTLTGTTVAKATYRTYVAEHIRKNTYICNIIGITHTYMYNIIFHMNTCTPTYVNMHTGCISEIFLNSGYRGAYVHVSTCSEFLLIHHHFICQTYKSTTISHHQRNIHTGANEYPVNSPKSLIHHNNKLWRINGNSLYMVS